MYKTIALRLLEARPDIHDRHRRSRSMLRAVDHYAHQLKARHEAWKGQLARTRPGSSESQISSEALEIAIQEVEGGLTCGDLPEGNPLPPIDEATGLTPDDKPQG